MGLLSKLTGGGSDDPDSDPDGEKGDGRINDEWVFSHYEVKYSPKNEGGWNTVSVGGQEKWGYPITEREFRANMTELDPGQYRLWSVDERNIHHPPRDQDEEWVITVDDNTPTQTDTDPSVQRLEQKVDALAGRLEDSGGMPHDPDQMVEYARAQIAMGALNSEQFLNRYGAEIAMGVLGGNSAEEEGIGFDEWQESPIGATIYESLNDPQKVEDLGQAFGSAGSNFLGGFMEEFSQGDGRTLTTGDSGSGEAAGQNAPDTAAEESTEEAPEPDDSGPSEIESGPSTLDGLADNIPDDASPDMEEVTQEFAETNMAMQDQRDAAEQASAEPDFPDPDEAATNGEAEPDADLTGGDPSQDRTAISDDYDSNGDDLSSMNGKSDSEDGEADTDSGESNDGPPAPETPGELRDLTWNELQQVASRNGLNPGEFGGQEALRSELERQMFGTPGGDDIEEATATATDDDMDDEVTPDDGDAGEQPTAQTEGENPSPDAVAEGL